MENEDYHISYSHTIGGFLKSLEAFGCIVADYVIVFQ
jgi:hypothetical protein